MVKCIRCDETVAEDYPEDLGEYVQLTYKQEAGAVVVCKDCFEVVKNRDLWN